MNKVKNLLEVSQAEKQAFLDSFDLVFTDCDGNKKKFDNLYTLIWIITVIFRNGMEFNTTT